VRGLFSAKGTVSKEYFGCCAILHVLAVPLGMAVVALSWDWAREHVEWVTRGWRPILPIIAIYLIAYRIFACAYVKRARAMGVEIGTGEVWYCFMGFLPGANIRDMMSSKSDEAKSRSLRDGADKLVDGRAKHDDDD
jgi:hypothetical protein